MLAGLAWKHFSIDLLDFFNLFSFRHGVGLQLARPVYGWPGLCFLLFFLLVLGSFTDAPGTVRCTIQCWGEPRPLVFHTMHGIEPFSDTPQYGFYSLISFNFICLGFNFIVLLLFLILLIIGPQWQCSGLTVGSAFRSCS